MWFTHPDDFKACYVNVFFLEEVFVTDERTLASCFCDTSMAMAAVVSTTEAVATFWIPLKVKKIPNECLTVFPRHFEKDP